MGLAFLACRAQGWIGAQDSCTSTLKLEVLRAYSSVVRTGQSQSHRKHSHDQREEPDPYPTERLSEHGPRINRPHIQVDRLVLLEVATATVCRHVVVVVVTPPHCAPAVRKPFTALE
jgi:hypothetical protein